MGKKDNKKVKGAVKSAAKSDKKTAQKIKKNLKAKGEDDIDTLLAKFAESDRKQREVVEELCKQPPSKRSAFTLTPHPEKDQLVLYGGEHFNGTESVVYSDLYTYTVKQDRWHRIISPGGPPPRCAHQSVALPQGGGQLWVFGGEFTSKSQSQFYHYKDLWMFSLTTKKWENIKAPDGPSARSGHRMVASKKKLFVFGGFHDNGYSYKYFNDVHAFDLETFKWIKLKIVGKEPAPRSACGLGALSDGRLAMYGGYSRTQESQGKDVGHTHSDMFHLVPDKHDTSGLKYKWVTVKQSGDAPTPIRCSFAFSACTTAGTGGWGEDKAVLFGGVNDTDHDEEDDIEGQFFDELYLLDMVKGSWNELYCTGKKPAEEEEKKSRRRKQKEGDSALDGEELSEEEEAEGDKAGAAVSDKLEDLSMQQTTVTDGVFTLTQASISSAGPSGGNDPQSVGDNLLKRQQARDVFVPPPRISSGVAVRKGQLYLYGGLYEDGDKHLTLNDFYSCDLSKLEEWRTIKALDPKDLEWFESDSSSGEEESGSDDDDDDDDDEEMETDE